MDGLIYQNVSQTVFRFPFVTKTMERKSSRERIRVLPPLLFPHPPNIWRQAPLNVRWIGIEMLG